MFHLGRSGSSALGELLDRHPGVLWDSEIHLKRDGLYGSYGHEPGALIRRRSASAGRRAYGWECKHLPEMDLGRFGLSASEYIDRMRSIGMTHVVLLRRKNVFRQILSTAAAVQRGGAFHNYRENPEPVRFRFEVDKATVSLRPGEPLASLIDRFESAHESVRQAAIDMPFLELVYEDDIQHGVAEAYRRVCGFLGIEPSPVAGRRRPSNPFPTRQIVTNIEEIRDHLAGTPHAWMAEEADEPATAGASER